MRTLTTLVTAAVLLTLAAPAHAQHPAAHDHGPMFLPSVQYGTPLKLSAGLGVFFETSADGPLTSGLIAEGAAGQGGFRASFGLARFLENMGFDARAVVHRTWASPRGASAEATYAGAEAGLTIAYVRVSAGVAQRLTGADGADRTIFTWSAGVHVPLWR